MKTFCLIAFVIVFGAAEQNRISIKKCKEYGLNVPKPCVSGNRNTNELAAPKEFPHMALIGHGNEDEIEWICSGSLISDQYVLSVAHCAASVPLKGRAKWIRLGELDLTSTTDDAQTKDFNISEVIIHPGFKRPDVYNDIVLFKLDRPVQFNEYIRPACLASNQEEINTINNFIISGWGEKQGIAHKHLKQDKNLHKVTYEECNKLFETMGKRSLKDGINETTQLCVKPSKTEACHIKSGAPLQYYNTEDDCMYNIVGLLSFGLGFCGSFPEIYSYVPGFIDWIESVVWP